MGGRVEGSTMERCFFMTLIMASVCFGQDLSPCCARATGSCRTLCEEISIVEYASGKIDRDEFTNNLTRYCPLALDEFWKCMNDTIEDIHTGSSWWGRTCCSLPRTPGCRYSCATSANSSSILPACRRSDEHAFFECLDRKDEAQACCSETQSIKCYEACWEVFHSTGDVQLLKRKAKLACEQNSHSVIKCLQKQTKVSNATQAEKYLPCCRETTNLSCKETCERILVTKRTTQEITAGLQDGGCNHPSPHEPMWQCFLRMDRISDLDSEVAVLNRIGIDSTKLHCCQKASSPFCNKLCFNTFNTDWVMNWRSFDSECLRQPHEKDLTRCIDEVDEQCELGCNGLSYCTNFNGRPSELFRSCNNGADVAAHYSVVEWLKNRSMNILESNFDSSQPICDEKCRLKDTSGCLFPDNIWNGRIPVEDVTNFAVSSYVITLAGMKIPILNNSQCPLNTLKAIACTLHIGPCKEARASSVCEKTCENLVSRCVPKSAHSAARGLCKLLADETEQCVDLNHYFSDEENAVTDTKEMKEVLNEVSSPCKSNPCNATQICEVNRNCRSGEHSCAQYKCVPACPMGDSSRHLVPVGTFVRVPMSTTLKSCHKICECTEKGVIENCQPMPCFSYDNCSLLNRKILHGSTYYMECNICICAGGERVCSSRSCSDARPLTRLPCNCLPTYRPVCAASRTFPDLCLARCSGYSEMDIISGECSRWDTCSSSPCAFNRHTSCLPRPTTCLSMLQQPCPQHVCVNSTNCARERDDPVCDVTGRTYRNPCHLISGGRELAYWGECLRGCDRFSPVCGINGQTYQSECEAWANFVSIDYLGPCSAIAPISNDMFEKCSRDNIKCPSLKRKNCVGFTAPGACCPICGGAMRILYSKKQIDRVVYRMSGNSAHILNLEKLLSSLQRHVTILECVVRGHLTVEHEIFVSVESALRKPSEIQMKTCVLEAERLITVVNKQSARFLSELTLSPLLHAIQVHRTPSLSSILSLDLQLLIYTSMLVWIVR